MPVHRQTGVALLTVLLVVFLASVAAISLASVQQLTIRRSTLLLHQQQAQLYALGAEQWAAAILVRDLEDNQTDHLNEVWATLPPTLPVEGGSITGDIQDLQGRFNLNNLLRQDNTIDENWLQALQRLLDALELNPGIAQAIVDWIDSDMEPRFPDGAEDGEYVGHTPPYVAANQPLVNISELRLVKGMDEESFNQLAPHICALPPGASRINVNTASAPVLASLSEGLNLASAEALIEDRDPEGYSEVKTFIDAAQLGEDALPPDNLAVSSEYFLARIEVNVGEGRVIINSTLQRSSEQGTNILMRSFGNDVP